MRWKQHKEKVSHRRTYQDTVFPVLFKLYTGEYKLEELEELNLSPKITKSGVRRDDLEFYTTQLCNILLFGDLQNSDSLVKFLIEACRSSFHFAHRVVWFLASIDFANLAPIAVPRTAPDRLMRAVEIAVHGSQRLYVSRGNELYELCRRLGLGTFPITLAAIALPAAARKEADSQWQKAREIITTYQESDDKTIMEAINPQFLTLQRAFVERNEDDFDATINFVKELTDASMQILDVADKKQQLIKIFDNINRKLPAAVYIPFTKYRNCCILHIHVKELKVFKTKERAPFLLTLEVFSPFEEYSTYLDESQPTERERSVSMPIAKMRARATIAVMSPSPEHEKKAEKVTQQAFLQIMNDAESTIPRDRAANRSINGSFSLMPEAGNCYSVILPDNAEDLPSPEIEVPEETKKESYESMAKHYETGIPDIRRPRVHTIMFAYEKDAVDTPTIHEAEATAEDEVETSVIFGESPEEMSTRLKQRSPYRELKTWEILRLIVKSGDDLRQEQLAMQLITQFQEIFTQADLKLWLRPYDIVATGVGCGIIECVDAMSIDSIKKSAPSNVKSLGQFFTAYFGPERNKRYRQAQKNFVRSLAGYSLLCFILQIKDRHNGNILLDREGHLVHIDFGFMISNSPGGDFKFERAPFKLTDEYVSVMEGVRSSLFQEFRVLCVK